MKTANNIMHWMLVFAVAVLCACGGGGGGGGSAPALPGTIQFAQSVYDAAEGTSVNIFVTRSGGNSGVATVDYASSDVSAVAGEDYPDTSGTFTYANQTGGNQTISIFITDDDTAEGPESFTVTLSNVSGATPGAASTVTVNIIDNDTVAVSASLIGH